MTEFGPEDIAQAWDRERERTSAPNFKPFKLLVNQRQAEQLRAAGLTDAQLENFFEIIEPAD